jgi:hypothetical protein
MKKSTAVSMIVLAGFLLLGLDSGLAPRVYAQSGGKQLTDQEWQEIQKKRQKEWEDSEKEDQRRSNTYQRRQDAQQRQRDAEKRQRDAEKKMQELDN